MKLFETYPTRDYPPDPIWDKKKKVYLDPVTLKPLDPKKPQILSLVPEKMSKKSKGKIEVIIPEWAEVRANLIQKIQLLQSLINNPELKFDQDFLERSKIELLRMNKENKYRNRIELDQKIIDEINSKKKK